MNKLFPLLLFTALSIISVLTQADEKEVKAALAKAMPSMPIDSIKPSEIKGLYEVTSGANLFYFSGDGKYLIQGHILDVNQRKDITEEKTANVRKAALEKLGAKKMIIFDPKVHKYTVTIFTDIDCGYCRKLHSEIDQYLAEGITVRYLFFPRAGKDSDSYKKAVAVWCAGDNEQRQKALTEAKKGNDPAEKTCDNPVDEHMNLGADFDVNGTPMIVSENGVTYPGYLPAKQLAEALANEKSDKAAK